MQTATLLKLSALKTDTSIWEILERNGYSKRTPTAKEFKKLQILPDVGCRSTIFTKDQKDYVFIQWESDEYGHMKLPAKYIEIMEVFLK